jgi:hypothetical protein
MVCCCEHCNESFGSIKGGNFSVSPATVSSEEGLCVLE